MAKAALEMAAWDLEARRRGSRCATLLGAAARPIPAGVSIGIQPSLDALAERVAAELAEGYRRIKIKIKPGWDRGARRTRLRATFRRHPPDGRCQRGLHAVDAAALAALDDSG